MESGSRNTGEVAAKATPKPAAPSKPADTGSPEPADMATPEPAYWGPSKSAGRGSAEPADRAASKAADMATPKSAARSGDEITSNPTYVTASGTKASATKAASEPSTPRRRDVYDRSGQGSRNGKNSGCVQNRTERAPSRHRIVRWRSRSNSRAAECGRSDCGCESADPNGCSVSRRAWFLTRSGQLPRQLWRQLRDPAVSKQANLLLPKRRYRRNEEIGL
jgi:hypothetical protein